MRSIAVLGLGLAAWLLFGHKSARSVATSGVVMLASGVPYAFRLHGRLPGVGLASVERAALKAILETSGAWDVRFSGPDVDQALDVDFTRTVNGPTPIILGSLQQGLVIARIERLDGQAI